MVRALAAQASELGSIPTNSFPISSLITSPSPLDTLIYLHLGLFAQSQEKWSALYDVRTILLSIQSLLAGQ